MPRGPPKKRQDSKDGLDAYHGLSMSSVASSEAEVQAMLEHGSVPSVTTPIALEIACETGKQSTQTLEKFQAMWQHRMVPDLTVWGELGILLALRLPFLSRCGNSASRVLMKYHRLEPRCEQIPAVVRDTQRVCCFVSACCPDCVPGCLVVSWLFNRFLVWLFPGTSKKISILWPCHPGCFLVV